MDQAALREEVERLPPQRRKILREALERILTGTSHDGKWAPFPGPQTEALNNPADILFYGGAAGGGKTDLLVGAALTQHKRSIIFRREFTQLQAINDRLAEIVGSRDGYNGQLKRWLLPGGRQVELGACQFAGDEQAYQGRPHDLKCFDELPHFLESQFRFLCGWLRSSDPAQRCRVICAGNPPTDPEGEWVISYFAPWLDEQHANPAAPGELRWFTTIDGKDVECPNGDAFEYRHEDGRVEIVRPISRTVIFATVEDNPVYVASGYKTILQALPEPLRSKMLLGSFAAAQEDNPWQIIPTAWVKAAQERWKERQVERGQEMDALGLDIARGGQDKTVLTPRWGSYFGTQIAVPGKATPDGPSVAALIVQHRGPLATVNLDAVGVGSSVADICHIDGIPHTALNGASACKERDRSGRLGFVNLRACLYWRMREALDPVYGDDIALPPDRELLADLCAPRWKLTVRGIQVESKEEIIKRIGRSPDKGDSAVYALHAPESTVVGVWKKPPGVV
jgi:hypothetical protein